MLDQPTDIRDDECFDVSKIDEFIKQLLPELKGRPEVKQYANGASNLTYLLQYPEQALILRRPPLGKVAKSAHNMIRESEVMRMLRPVYPYVPQIIAQCRDNEVIGCDFYLMERLVGIIPRQNMPPGLALSTADTRQLCLNAIDKLVELHQVDHQQAGLASIGKGSSKDSSYVQRQIDGWIGRLTKAQTPDSCGFSRVIRWLQDNMPEDIATCVIHNDYRFDNLVLNPDNPLEIIGVLDWEMATLGDPLMDLGNTLAYWVEAGDDDNFQQMRRQPTHLEGMLTRQQVIDYYLEKSGLVIDSFDFYQVYGLFRLAAIIQQIYTRYYHGQTKDPRFAGFAQVGHYLEQRCLQLINQSGEKA